ncbi:MAG TPA: hypothetical protein VD997_03275 [Phycisphaerales bacterium]|nr:hypothetical protein [Phycisphaerales bacterium]
MRTRIAAIAAVVGIAATVHAQTEVKYQVSRAGQENWSSSLSVAPNTPVDIRVLVSYKGLAPALGLGSVIFQPTISNWVSSGAADSLTPINAIGWVTDAPNTYGKMSPFVRTNGTLSTPQAYVGHSHNISGTNYLRIALPHVTSWFGGTGNTSGGSGILIGQINQNAPGRPTNLPPASTANQEVVVLKFKINIGAALDPRLLTITTPANGFGNLDPDSGLRTGNWFANSTEHVGSIQEAAFATPAFINVIPAPGTCVLISTLLVVARRRR